MRDRAALGIGTAGRSVALMSPEGGSSPPSPPFLRFTERPAVPILPRGRRRGPRLGWVLDSALGSVADVRRPMERSKGGEALRSDASGDMSAIGRLASAAAMATVIATAKATATATATAITRMQ